MYAAATMSLGAVLLLLIATGAMVSGQQSMSIVDSISTIVLCSFIIIIHTLVSFVCYHRKLSELIKHQ